MRRARDRSLFTDRHQFDVGACLQVANQAPELAGQILVDEEDA
jgi:hypothetical protein